MEVYDNVLFHGGQGLSLEMRVFRESDLRSKLLGSGFQELTFMSEDYPKFGIFLEKNCSLPLVARKEDFTLPTASTPLILESYHKELQQLREVKKSRWVKLGRLVGLGPKL